MTRAEKKYQARRIFEELMATKYHWHPGSPSRQARKVAAAFEAKIYAESFEKYMAENPGETEMVIPDDPSLMAPVEGGSPNASN